MNLPHSFVLALIVWRLASGQAQLTDEMIMRLGGDPVALRQQALQRQKEAPNPEDLTLREQVAAMARTITAADIASLENDNPLLKALYAHRVRFIDDASGGWAQVIDQDILRRKEGGKIMMAVFQDDGQPNQNSVLYWLDKHRDVDWGDEIMEEAIKLYRADPKGWNYSGIAVLRRLVAGRGNKTHLAFFDELEKTEFGSGGDRDRLKLRIERDKKWAAYFGLPANVSVSELAKYVRFDPSPRGTVPVYVGSGPPPPGDPPSPFGQPMLPMGAAQEVPSASIQPSATKTVAPAAQLPKATQSEPLVQRQEQRKSHGKPRLDWIAGTVVVMAAIGILWLMLKTRQ